jgi:hypothetical protein
MVWRRISFLAAASIAALGLRPGVARAEFTYVTAVSPDGASGTGSYLTLEGQAVPSPEALPTDIKVADIYVTDRNLGAPYQDVYSFGPGTLTVHVDLTDDSGPSHDFTFTNSVLFQGTVGMTSGGAFETNWTVDPFGSQSQSYVLGGNEYTVWTIPGKKFQAVGAPAGPGASGLHGGFSFRVSSAAVPEPASLVMGGTAALAGLAAWARGRIGRGRRP